MAVVVWVALQALLLVGAQARCDISGDWIGFHFLNYDEQPSSSIQVCRTCHSDFSIPALSLHRLISRDCGGAT
jgi:hypothetical protein